MDTVTAFARRPESAPSVAPATATLETHRTLAVTATYLLSEEGRKVLHPVVTSGVLGEERW